MTSCLLIDGFMPQPSPSPEPNIEIFSSQVDILTFRKDLSHFEEGSCESDYTRFIKLTCYCGRKGQQTAQLKELSILLLSPVPGRVLALVLHDREEVVLVGGESEVIVVSRRTLPAGHNTVSAEHSDL